MGTTAGSTSTCGMYEEFVKASNSMFTKLAVSGNRDDKLIIIILPGYSKKHELKNLDLIKH